MHIISEGRRGGERGGREKGRRERRKGGRKRGERKHRREREGRKKGESREGRKARKGDRERRKRGRSEREESEARQDRIDSSVCVYAGIIYPTRTTRFSTTSSYCRVLKSSPHVLLTIPSLSSFHSTPLTTYFADDNGTVRTVPYRTVIYQCNSVV
jgi:hypothetical protein